VTNASYKHFELVPRCYQLHETREWTVDIEIRRRGRSRSFSTRERYPDEQQAVARSLRLARQIIDGQVPRTSVDALR
jgi:hypothetical protein